MKKETRIQHILRSIVRYVVASASLSIVFYILFALQMRIINIWFKRNLLVTKGKFHHLFSM